ncbi:MAG: serine/threonine protein kinase [Bythopirellula sp.]|nr:serine/threonine protein kinase [Bythopirellula sp.]
MKLNPFSWLSNSLDGGNQRAPHMTFATSNVGRTISRTKLFLRKQIWIWPIIAVMLLSLIGLMVRSAIETTMRESLESQLGTILHLQTSMLETWFKVQKSNAESSANSLEIRKLAYPLIEADGTPQDSAESNAELRINLGKALGPALTAHDYDGFLLVNKASTIVAANRTELVGRELPPEYEDFVSQAMSGMSGLSPPFASIMALKDNEGEIRTGVPTMFVAAPIRDESFQVVGVLAFRIQPEKDFSRILELGQFGESGESYAFDKNARMVSNSRFDKSLILNGLIPDEEDSRSILRLLIRDPGGDVTRGFQPTKRRHELPLTFMAEEAIAGRPGINVEGYRGYRGVNKVGAWTWLPEANIGVATEMDYSEAFRPLTILRWTFWALFALLALSALAIFAFTLVVARLRREAQKAAIDAQQIGQYTLEQKLGAGGMGVVYKGQHAMLRRPTAIKMLDIDKVNEASMERFEREVQITSQLNNPHTVAIYDYGRTPEGVFYYAMEYLDGIDLQTLVERYGPQSAPRVIHILEQICSSLYEAHSLGLVHRDIKPANIMLNRRGGEPDVVKVLDFGLVKALDDGKQNSMTQQSALTGTPLYMSPEAIQMPNSVDSRSDIYAVGAVGYFLLTGGPVFDADNVMDLCRKHVDTPPLPPSERTRLAIPAALENALLSCLEKSRAKRPQTARDLAEMITNCPEASVWSVEEADAWWGRHERGLVNAANHGAPTATRGHDVTIDLS